MKIVKLDANSKNDLLVKLLKRSPSQYTEYENTVAQIIENIRAGKNRALFDYTKQFDKCEIDEKTIEVTEEEFKEAYETIDPALLETIRKSAANIKKFHEKQKQRSWFDTQDNGIFLGQKVTAIEKVGVYVPGGRVLPVRLIMQYL